MFRLRTNESFATETAWHDAERPHRAHLRKLTIDRGSDLWRYFAVDFFHDGHIGDVRMDDSMQRVRCSIDCPNIRHRTGAGFEYLDASFQCEFGGIAHLAMTARRIDEHNDPLDAHEPTVTFMASEIDTLDSEIRAATALFGRTYHSLVIETMTASRFIELVFEYVSVAPVDRARFEELCANPDYIIPRAGPEAWDGP